MEKPIVEKTYLLQKYPGKGGWTYEAKKEETKVERIAFMMEKRLKTQRLQDKG